MGFAKIDKELACITWGNFFLTKISKDLSQESKSAAITFFFFLEKNFWHVLSREFSALWNAGTSSLGFMWKGFCLEELWMFGCCIETEIIYTVSFPHYFNFSEIHLFSLKDYKERERRRDRDLFSHPFYLSMYQVQSFKSQPLPSRKFFHLCCPLYWDAATLAWRGNGEYCLERS